MAAALPRAGDAEVQVPDLVAELIHAKVDLLVVSSVIGIRAAMQATKKIAIVTLFNVDPVSAGMIDNLAHPGGNITGLSSLSRDLSAKRIELLGEVIPGISRIAVLRDVDGPGSAVGFNQKYTCQKNDSNVIQINLVDRCVY